MSDPKDKANNLIKEGKEAFDNQKYEISITKLGEACQLLDQLNGDLAPENGDAYFMYGKALLQYAIQQNTVLGQSAQANAVAVEEQQRETKQAEEGSSNPLIQMESIPEFKQEEEEEEDEEEDEEDNENGDQADDDFETAWDILDVARLIFEKGEDKETQLKLADVHLCLADVSLETEKFDQSLSDYEKAIEIKEKWLEEDNRELAEAYYKYSLALEFSSDKSDEAVPELRKAIDVLKKRLSKLESIEDTTEKVKDEIKDIQELISDMNLKAEELTTKQATEKEAAAMLKQILGFGAGGNAPNKPIEAASVNDLSNLVKRKAKESAKDAIEKKPKLE
ncbi:hypothetical protein RMCBS344292_03651 [Rhizopus microsporus]|nr:hypothetical protein RMCBS344292_03651 [Rhizopus microsporus]